MIKLFFTRVLKNILNFISISLDERTKVDFLLNALKSFSILKNAGLYADYRNNIWNTPLELKEDDYKKVLENTNLMRSIFFPKIAYFLKISNENLVSLYEALH